MKTNYRFGIVSAAALVGVMVHAAATQGAPFTPGNLALYRIGTGDVSVDVHGTAVGAPVFIDEYTTSGTLVQSIAMPTIDPDADGPQRRLVAQGSATLEGLLNRSTDGRYLMITGYDAAVGETPLAMSLASAVPRVVGRISANGTFDTSTVIPDLDDGTGSDSGSPRSAMSTNGTDIYVTGAEGGVRLTTFGSTGPTTQINSALTNLRHVDIFSGQMYASTMSGTSVRIGTVGTGIPTTGSQTVTSLPGVPGTGTPNPDPTQFWMADLSETEPGADVLYIADARSQGTGGGIYKYSLVSGTWVASGSIAGTQTPPVSILRGITGSVSGSSVTLYVTRNNGQQLMSITDASGQSGTLTGSMTALATLPNSPARWKFAGIDFVPVDAAPIPGDFNGDTEVNDADFAVWRDEFGETLDGEDFLTWQQHYNPSVPEVMASAGRVPEPATASLAGAALIGAVALLRRRSAR